MPAAKGSARTPLGPNNLFLLSYLVLDTVVKTPEGVVVGIQIFAWAPNLYK